MDLISVGALIVACWMLAIYLTKQAHLLGNKKYLQHVVFESTTPSSVSQKKSLLRSFIVGVGIGIAMVALMVLGYFLISLCGVQEQFIGNSYTLTDWIAFGLGAALFFLILRIGQLVGTLLGFIYTIKNPLSIQGTTHIKQPMIRTITISVLCTSMLPVIIALLPSAHSPYIMGALFGLTIVFFGLMIQILTIKRS